MCLLVAGPAERNSDVPWVHLLMLSTYTHYSFSPVLRWKTFPFHQAHNSSARCYSGKTIASLMPFPYQQGLSQMMIAEIVVDLVEVVLAKRGIQISIAHGW